ncbi:hypothetical protein A2303_02730 [Candidatus Falkowbacteria bacterium RIFOXYB2_FULL_47_14]|uniref:DUF5666 domain-containing protein n=1 Tax=Candidatus Falkowbacteria bacterium RIFOXYA2_FULL_47_19 TaxID=1797994 RepID=A0A1F5SLL0_9BACT|nr:MAG: hypothetical protein A2227_01805 [Candidatus Falkowbacteria bacterium RIFOXYA2_FULL_47_19]OGF36834.1 MAG: hypothetical protein A2468_07345 [Candidatus Falkowbacteria bacterium RIFOXYC2_FULL_46_15]OGF43037.1 MAG: hypothetical protein A2303_02730 [Candidatus Falkowbacteria bacterium RIFOXYB2_FULL_47_14]
MFIKYFKKINYIIIASLLLLPAGTRAFSLDDLMAEYDEVYYYDDSGSVEITNDIKTSASSGGNTAKNGAVIEGKTRSEIEIETEINGTRVMDIKTEKETENGVLLKIENQVNVDSDKAETETEVEINGEIKKENRTVDLNPKNPADDTEIAAPQVEITTDEPVEAALDVLWDESEESAEGGLCSFEESDCAEGAGSGAEDDRPDDNGGIAAVWSGFIGAIKAGILKILGLWG